MPATFQLSRPAARPKLPLTDAPPVKSFDVAYRPRHLGEVYGQTAIVEYLREFVARPMPRAFLFSGDTGLGKSATAEALARDLGVPVHKNSATWHHVMSGTMDMERTEQIIADFRYVPWGGGWRVVLVDEADTMSPKAKLLWLSAIEKLPENTVVIWTTNHPDKFDTRTLDRFKHLEFVAPSADDVDAAQAYADLIWQAETGGDDAPDVSTLPNVAVKGVLSFRRIASAMQDVVQHGGRCSRPAAAPVTDAPPAPVRCIRNAPSSPPEASAPIKAPILSLNVSIPRAGRETVDIWWSRLGLSERQAALHAIDPSKLLMPAHRDRLAKRLAERFFPDYHRDFLLQPAIDAAHRSAKS